MQVFPFEIDYYITKEGKKPFGEWPENLKDVTARAKIRVRLDRARLGNLGDNRSVGEGVRELRMAKLTSYQKDLIKSLKDPCEAAAYLNAAIEEGDRAVFLLALRNVAEANGGMAAVAGKAKLSRESLYRMLSKKGNPEIKSLIALLHTMGLRMSVEAEPHVCAAA